MQNPIGIAQFVSIVVPVYNEKSNIAVLVERILAVLRPLEYPFELILVDDGSSDGTWNAIVEISHATAELKGYRLSRNFGHQGALLAGLNVAKGDAVVSLDGDLQHPPELIPKMLEEWRAGAKLVLTKRIDDAETSAFKKLTSRYFYRFFSALAETEIEAGSSDFRLLDRAPLDDLKSLNFGQPFLRGAVETIGYPKAIVEFEVAKRHSGTSKYTLPKMIRFAKNGLISHSSVPLRIGIWVGLVTGILSIAELTYVVVQFFSGATVPGWASSIGITSLFFGVMFFLLGLIGLYLEDIHTILKRTPHFIVSESTPDYIRDVTEKREQVHN